MAQLHSNMAIDGDGPMRLEVLCMSSNNDPLPEGSSSADTPEKLAKAVVERNEAQPSLAQSLLQANQELRASIVSNVIRKGLIGLGVGIGLGLFVFKSTSTY